MTAVPPSRPPEPPDHPRFEVRSLLGQGAEGVVYEAFDRELESRVALKALRAREGGALVEVVVPLGAPTVRPGHPGSGVSMCLPLADLPGRLESLVRG